MYVYNRHCYKALKSAAVFPIEVQLGIDATAAVLPSEQQKIQDE